MGPDEDSTRPAEDQEHGPAARPGCRPRSAPRVHRCLLKGCEQPFHPRRVDQRYCGEECRRAARRWSRWKAQQNYRATTAGKDKRNGQSRRYRERVRSRPPAATEEAVLESARVITKDFFSTIVATGRAAMRDSFRNGDRHISVSVHVHAGALWNESGSGSGAGAAGCDCRRGFEPKWATDKPDVLIGNNGPAYIRAVEQKERRGCCAGPARICCHSNLRKSASITGATACTCRKPNAPWRSRWSVTGSYRRSWYAVAGSAMS